MACGLSADKMGVVFAATVGKGASVNNLVHVF